MRAVGLRSVMIIKLLLLSLMICSVLVIQGCTGSNNWALPGAAFNSAPTVIITSPLDMSEYGIGSNMTFTGTGVDADEGSLTGTSLVWTSDQDGQIGTGGTFDTAALSENTHVITLTATDASGEQGTATVTIKVRVPWFAAQWGFRQMIIIDSTMTASDQADFPALIKITNQTNPLFGKALSNGDDILFTEEDGVTQLDHEIEYYKDTTTKELDAWVRIPTLSSSENTIIYMYYGNSSALNQENSTGVWDNNFTTIQHLNETSGQHSDSTSNGSDSTVVNVTPQGSASGQIDGADGFDGIDDQVRLNTRFTLGPPQLITDTTGTIEAWVKPTGSPASEPTDVWRLPPVIGDLDGSLGIHRGSLGGQDRIWVYKWDTNADVIGISYTVDEWVHIVWVHENGNLRAYKNGEEVAGSPILSGDTAWSNWAILGTSNVSSNSFNGLIDEVRTSNIDRTDDWINASYLNQNDPGTGDGGNPDVYTTFATEEVN